MRCASKRFEDNAYQIQNRSRQKRANTPLALLTPPTGALISSYCRLESLETILKVSKLNLTDLRDSAKFRLFLPFPCELRDILWPRELVRVESPVSERNNRVATGGKQSPVQP